MAVPGVRAATYDGDTPPDERRWIRDHANVVLTNPDLLHHSLLPGHERWSRFLRSLEYVVVDECHVYRGVFGSHVAAVLRRLRRVAARYGASPTFVLASATVSEPATHASRLIGMPVAAVTDDGSPRGAMTFALWEPGTVDGHRRSATTEAAEILAELVLDGVQAVAFARSRAGAEALATNARRRVEHDDPARAEGVAAYRGGYLPQDRREIERGLRDGSVRGLAATNALELGIDVSGLDAVVMAGWPGRRASLWQQAGRAGRSGEESLAVLVAADDPLDTYLVRHPEAIFGAAVEATVLDPHNPHVLAPHLAAAAAELPLGESDLPMFGPDARRLLDALVASGILRRRPSGWFWAREDRPAEHISLRGASDVVAVVEARTGRVLGTVDEASSHAQVHTGAVHVHQGDTWVVTELDLEARAAHVVRGDPGWSTHAQSVSRFDILGRERTERRARVEVSFGTVRVTSQVTGFLRRLPSGEVLGTHPLDLPERAADHEGGLVDRARRRAGRRRGGADRGARGAARRGARGHRDAAAGRDLRPVGRRRGLDGVAPRHRPAHDHGVRRLPGRCGVRRARVRGVRGVGARHPRRRARVPVRHGVPGVRAVAQVRQRQRAARQGRGGHRARAGPGAGRGLTRAPCPPVGRRPDPSATFDPVEQGCSRGVPVASAWVLSRAWSCSESSSSCSPPPPVSSSSSAPPSSRTPCRSTSSAAR